MGFDVLTHLYIKNAMIWDVMFYSLGPIDVSEKHDASTFRM